MISNEAKLAKIRELERKKKFREELPHLYSQKHYTWSRRFFESVDRMVLLLCGNQIGKSSTQIKKHIHWATANNMWKKWWNSTPRQFWYLYPSLNVATAEFETKWVPEFMPRGDMKNHPQYGWNIVYKQRQVQYIQWNSGVRSYFHAYSKGASVMQSASVHRVDTDEELPEHLYQELSFRLAAVEGYFGMVFTATLGQDLWYRAMERIGKKNEAFVNAKKIRATAYDCLEYEDGDTNTPWTIAKIKQLKATCATENEVNKRVYGRFVMDDGLVLSEFRKSKNVVKAYEIPKDWYIYTGVDVGGGGKSHKGGIAFVAVKPDFTKGALFRGWKGNAQEVTAASDILRIYREKRGDLIPVQQKYDWASKDFHTYASRLGETFIPAEKGVELGRTTMNTLFKLKMFDIFDIEELDPFVQEAQTLTLNDVEGRAKRSANDDLYDATRYAITDIPWDYTIAAKMYAEPEKVQKEEKWDEITMRREMFFGKEDVDDDGIKVEDDRIEDEIEEYNDLY